MSISQYGQSERWKEIDCFNDYTIALTLLALRSSPTEWADTSEAIDLIHTGGTVGAGWRLALINVWWNKESIPSSIQPLTWSQYTFINHQDWPHPLGCTSENEAKEMHGIFKEYFLCKSHQWRQGVEFFHWLNNLSPLCLWAKANL